MPESKPKSTTKKSAHPPYKQMISDAVRNSNDSYATLQSIKKYMEDNYGLPANFKQHLSAVLRKMLDTGLLEHPRGHAGSYKFSHGSRSLSPLDNNLHQVKKGGVGKSASKRAQVANVMAEQSKSAKAVKA